jgi:putative ABC transport system permease protein
MNGRRERRIWKPDVRKDVDDELAFHLEMRERDLAEQGAAPREARDEARRRFGNLHAVAAVCRDIDDRWYREQRRASMWTDLMQDVGYALRMLAKAPGFTTAAVLTLALGIGVTTAVFGLINWTLLRPLPGVRNPSTLAWVWSGSWSERGGFSVSRLTYPNYLDIAPRLETITGLAGIQGLSAAVAAGAHSARPVPAQLVTASYFDVLGVTFAAGRPFTADEDAPGRVTPVAVISERLWTTMFDRSPSALGQTIHVNRIPLTVIGITAAGFQGTDRVRANDLWIPGNLSPLVNHGRAAVASRASGGFYEWVARLAPRVNGQRAQAELHTLTAWLAEQYPEANKKFTQQVRLHVFGPIGVDPLLRDRLSTSLALMMGLSALVLLIACANVANLLIMRGVGRTSETALRKALGASRFRLLRQHLTEGLTLWTLGGIGGAILAMWLTRLMEGIPLAGRTAIADVPMDWRVLGFSAVVSLIVGLLFSVLPARRAIRVEAAETLKSAGSPAARRRFAPASILTVVQLAASLTLVVGALLLVRTLQHLGRVELGFEPRGVLSFFVQPGMLGYGEAASYQYMQQFMQRLQGRGGIESIALSQGATPFFDANASTRVRVMGDASNASLQRARTAEIWSTGYFDTLRIPLLRGRTFTADDIGTPGMPARRVVIVNEWLARDLFGSIEGAVGQSVEFRILGSQGPCEIIGVVGNALYSVLTEERAPMIFEPAGLNGPLRTEGTITLRSSSGIDAAAAAREIAASLDRSLPLGRVMTMEQAIDEGLAQWNVLARLLTALALVAGLLSAIGVYAVVSFGVAARRREFGIRMALGAEPAVVRWLVLRGTAIIAAVGLLVGLGGAIALARALESSLFGVPPFDPIVWTMAAVLLVALAFAASIVPARRATRVDVVETLRAL